ncbi:MAG: SPOR domain-containing protein [Candidatus Omnitrophica bacterium]|nr:SPOR domain-containing protein [Candidatus Omnitrophota bacterium]
MEYKESLLKKIFSWTNIGFVVLFMILIFFVAQLLESWKPEEPSVPEEISEQEDFFPEEIDQKIVEVQQEDEVFLQPLIEKKFLVQVASFQDKKRSDTAIEELKKKGYAPFVETKDLNEKGIWYRVYADGFETKDQAQSFLDMVKKDYPGSFIRKM